MAILNTVTPESIIAHVYRTFHITNSSWEGDAPEFIGHGLSIIGNAGAVEQQPMPVVVTNNFVRVPCNTDELLFIEYNGTRVPPLDGIRGIKGDKVSTAQTGYWYYIKGKYIHFSDKLNDKTVIIHKLGFMLDEKGFPLVPDTGHHIEALGWFIIRALCLQGYTHPVIDYKEANRQWEIHYPRAQNAGKRLSLDEMNKIKDLWTGWANDYNRAKRFNGASTVNSPTSDYTEFKQTRQQTIIHVEVPSTDLNLSTDI